MKNYDFKVCFIINGFMCFLKLARESKITFDSILKIWELNSVPKKCNQVFYINQSQTYTIIRVLKLSIYIILLLYKLTCINNFDIRLNRYYIAVSLTI